MTTPLIFYLWNAGLGPLGTYSCAIPASFYDGFSGEFFPPPLQTFQITGFIYGLDEQTLYVTFANGSITGFSGVPSNTASQFNYAANPDIFYTNQILPFFAETFTCGSSPLG